MDNAYARWATRWRVPLGFLLGLAYLVFCRPTVRLLIAGGVVAAAGLTLRSYAAGYLVKSRALTVTGPYAWTRNPLYLGSTLMGAGFALAGGSVLLALACAVLFAAIYWPVIRREEDFLRREFGEAYENYARQVPLFLPRFRRAPEGGKFQWGLCRKNHGFEAPLGYLALMIFLAFKIWLR